MKPSLPCCRRSITTWRGLLGWNRTPVKWYRNWYNEVGFRLALGWSLDKIAQEYPEWANVCDWLQANYTSDA